ncbi:MAG: 3-dehydroquinate synthase [Patescibacteria group bacterium]|jgi:3-dehydroquinate synthase
MEKIIIGKKLFGKINTLLDFSRFSKIAVLTDKNIQMSLISQISQIKKSLNRELVIITIPAGENEKNIETVKKIWEKMFESGLDRRSLLINLGGGVICDIGGFSASTFMRGINFINIPTTLLSQVDASIGGKTGIDFMNKKNGIGVFNNPLGVVVDVDTLRTLPKRELIAAFGEIIKHGVISGREHFDLVTSKKPLEFNQQELTQIIKQSIKIKSSIVKKDPKEVDLRKVLNFGHTIGHAIESLSWTNKPLLHGEAVAIGIIAESNLACLRNPKHNRRGCTSELIKKVVANAGLPTKIKNIKPKDVVRLILSDKKKLSGKINWSLPKRIGKVLVNIEAADDLIIKAIESVII